MNSGISKPQILLALAVTAGIATGCEEPTPQAEQLDFHGLAPIHHAVRANDLAAMRTLLYDQEVDPNLPDANGVTPIHRAVRDGNMDATLLLLTYGADINVKTNIGWTPIQLAVRYNRRDIARLLISKDADLEVRTPGNGRSLLHLAVERGFVDMAYQLIVAGREVNQKLPGGDSLLHVAVRNEDIPMVNLLMNQGADLATPDKQGRTPYDLALELKKDDVARTLYDWIATQPSISASPE